ncbi:MAG: VOC family protein [Candidatus Odinarchaeota archaeon]
MVKINPYLIVKNAIQAIEMYKDLFGAKLIDRMPYSKEMGNQFGLPDNFNYENSTMHAIINIGGSEIMLADNIRGIPVSGNVEVVVHLDNKKQIETIYNKAKTKGFKIKMELQQTFWGAWYARFEDSEGVGWQLNFQLEETPVPKKKPEKSTKNAPKKASKKISSAKKK